MIEEWKDIPKYEGVYQASSLGNIRSLNYNKTKKIQVLKKSITNSGYFSTSLQTNKKPKKFLLHQLVAMAFLGHNPNGLKKVVNHINFNKLDNRIQNLEIITFRENSNLKHIPSSSRFTGVAWNKLAKKWQAQITINGRQKYLGLFDCELEASSYYEKALKSIEIGKKIIKKQLVFSSKYKGVHWNKSAKKWQSRIRINGKVKHIGYFDTELEAFESQKTNNTNL